LTAGGGDRPRCDAAANAAVYARGARAYDEVWSPVIRGAAQRVVGEIGLRDATRVLDVGAGTGALTGVLRTAAPGATVVSLDRSSSMLRHAVENGSAPAVVADAMGLPVASASVDALLLAYVLFMLPSPERALSEAARVLRDSGRVGTVTWADEAPSLAAKTWDATLDELGVPSVAAHSNHAGLTSTEGVTRHLRAAGLAPLHAWYDEVEHTFDPASFWRLRTEHGVSRVRLAALEPRRHDDVLAELRRRLALLGPADYLHRGRLVCAVAEKSS
jgi:ubiquinone/menaquinone biosynthesis C-methylase UbiE